MAKISGQTPRYSTGGGTSDGRFIAQMGAEVVELGVPNATIHKVNECVRVTDIDTLHGMYLQVLRNLLLLKSGKALSFGERKMLDSARSLLVKEISIAKSVTEAVVETDLRRFLNL